MTWSVSFTAPSKEAAKRTAVKKLAEGMLGQDPHQRDFQVVLTAVHGAIDACAEGTITVSGSGHLSGNWVDGDIPDVKGLYMNLQVGSAA